MTVNQSRQLTAARECMEHLAKQIDAQISVRLWDGSEVAMGSDVEPGLAVSISSPGVVSSLIRRPTLDNLVRHYARKHIDFHGADFYTFLEKARVRRSRRSSRRVSKFLLIKSLLPFLFARPLRSTLSADCGAPQSLFERFSATISLSDFPSPYIAVVLLLDS